MQQILSELEHIRFHLDIMTNSPSNWNVLEAKLKIVEKELEYEE